MIKKVIMYSVICDRCGKVNGDYDGIIAWLDEGTAKEQAMEREWIEIGDKHYCPDCYEFNDELDRHKNLQRYMVCLFGTAYFCNRLVLCLYGYKSINGGVGMKVQKCKHQVNNGWCKVRGGVCIWSEYTPEACLKREEV